uniref:Putative solute carrier family 16 monocarboxylic acid transporter n=1 Tax=Ixodes ricinus TaxID=34613 RepID=V5GZ63_IXORI
MVALGCSVGLILPPLHRKFSVTSVMVASSVLASVGLMASGFAPNIAWISVTLGVIHGFGAGTTYMSGNLLMMMYFDKLRGVALGFTSVGLTLAGLVFPRLLSALKDAYGFSGSFFVWGALIMNLIPLTCSLKVPPWHTPTKRGRSSAPSNSLVASNEINSSLKYGTSNVLR